MQAPLEIIIPTASFYETLTYRNLGRLASTCKWLSTNEMLQKAIERARESFGTPVRIPSARVSGFKILSPDGDVMEIRKIPLFKEFQWAKLNGERFLLNTKGPVHRKQEKTSGYNRFVQGLTLLEYLEKVHENMEDTKVWFTHHPWRPEFKQPNIKLYIKNKSGTDVCAYTHAYFLE